MSPLSALRQEQIDAEPLPLGGLICLLKLAFQIHLDHCNVDSLSQITR